MSDVTTNQDLDLNVKRPRKKTRRTKKADGSKSSAFLQPGLVKDDAQELLTQLVSTVGDENAISLADGGMHIKIRGVIPTTCFAIDDAIGRGGVPRGRITILHGGEGGGKTTLLLLLMAQVQRMGGIAVYIDAECKLDPEYAEALGVDLSSMIYVTPESLEDAMGSIIRIAEFAKQKREARGGESYPFFVALDSMNATMPQAVIDDPAAHHMGPYARIYSKMIPQAVKAIKKEDIALVLVSQLRKKLGLVFGDDTVIAGGNAPGHYASVIMFISRIAKIPAPTKRGKDGKKKKARYIGNRCRVLIKKNQIAPPNRSEEFTIWYGRGIDSELSLIEAAECDGVVERNGNSYSMGDVKLGVSTARAADFLRANPNVRDAIEGKLRSSRGW